MDEIKVSIIMPVYGVERHIERSLHSVMRQDYAGPLECIIVDDCTPDKSMEIADRLLHGYNGPIRFRVVRRQKNGGLSAARNTGIRESAGGHLFFLDSDDEIMPHAISTLMAMAEKYPGVDLVYGDWYTSHRYNGLQNKPGMAEYIPNHQEAARRIFSGYLSMTAPNKLFRAQFVRDNSLFFKEGILHEDTHLNYFIAEAVESIAVSYVPTYVYYLNPSGITGKPSERNIQSMLAIASDVLQNGKNWFRHFYALKYLNIIIQRSETNDNLRTAICLLKELAHSSVQEHLYLLVLLLQLETILPLSLKRTRLFQIFHRIAIALLWRIYAYRRGM